MTSKTGLIEKLSVSEISGSSSTMSSKGFPGKLVSGVAIMEGASLIQKMSEHIIPQIYGRVFIAKQGKGFGYNQGCFFSLEYCCVR